MLVPVVFSPLARKKPPSLQFLVRQARKKVRSLRRKRPKFLGSFVWNFLLFPNRLDEVQACFIEAACFVGIIAPSLYHLTHGRVLQSKSSFLLWTCNHWLTLFFPCILLGLCLFLLLSLLLLLCFFSLPFFSISSSSQSVSSSTVLKGLTGSVSLSKALST